MVLKVVISRIMMMVAMTIKMMVPIVVTLVGIVTDVKSIHLKNVYSSNGRVVLVSVIIMMVINT